MDEKLLAASNKLLIDCLGVQKNETLLIVSDNEKQKIGNVLYEAGQKIGTETIHMIMKEREKSGQEPPYNIAVAMASSDVVLCATKHSLTHTKARKNAVANGTRLATMPGITIDMFLQGAILADYPQVQVVTEKVQNILSKGNKVRIEKDGKQLEFSIEGRNGVKSTGVYLNKGESGNLPSGEAYIAPVEGLAYGEIVVDGSITGIGKIDSPITLKIEKGQLVDIYGEGNIGEKIFTILGEHDGRFLGEFGIGTNDKARITGVILEDEKVYGTIHVAFGSNITFGGTVEAGVHMDLIVTEPNVFIDDVLIIERGVHLY